MNNKIEKMLIELEGKLPKALQDEVEIKTWPVVIFEGVLVFVLGLGFLVVVSGLDVLINGVAV
jgi:hypothetical protein